MIKDEMRMRKILTDQFRSRKDSSPFIFKGGRERKGVDLLNYSCTRIIEEESQADQNAKEIYF